MRLSDYDRWLTTPPSWYDYEEPPQPKCPSCGAFISRNATIREVTTIKHFCDGHIHHWLNDYDESSIAILGEEYRGKTYKIHYVQCERDIETNLNEHEPHWFDYIASEVNKVRCKRCNKDIVIDGEVL